MNNFGTLLALVGLLVFSLFSCASESSDLDSNQSLEMSARGIQSALSPLEKWTNALNNGSIVADSIYAEDVVIVKPEGAPLIGVDSAVQFYSTQMLSVDTAISLGKEIVTHSQKGTFEYEVIGFTDSEYNTYRQLVITQVEGNKVKRWFEYTDKYEPTEGIEADIDERRTEWIKLCNEHNATKLVERLYDEETLYYNHRPILKGRTSVIEEYDYMNNPSYNLTLAPVIFEPVNENLVFEIGQCAGSYGGKYILVWRKDETGTWWIHLDANL